MTFNRKLLQRLGIILASSTLILTACATPSQTEKTGSVATTETVSETSLDIAAANDAELAKETAAGKEVEMYDTERPKTEDYSKVNQNQAKYVFMFIGDGMGVTPVTAAENYLGFTRTNAGEVFPDRMNFTEMPVVGLKTQFDCHSFIPDSASTATAFATGIKTQTNTVGLSGDFSKAADSVAEKAKRAGKSVGILSTVTLNHATPAAYYANEESRNSYYEIGAQMAETNFDYFAGGSLKHRTGKEKDQKDLFDIMKDNGYTIVETAADAEKIDKNSEKVYWVAEELQDDGAMTYAIDKTEQSQSFSDMVAKGIEVMEDNPAGFFMMAESGKIDWAEHANDGVTTMEEVIDFQESIQVAIDFYNEHPDDTLIVVTADHATGGFTIGNESTGYETYFDLLTNQKGSQTAFNDIVTSELEKNPNMTFEEFAPKIEEFFGLILDADAPTEMITNAEEEDYLKVQADNRLRCSKEEYEALKVAFEESKKDSADQNTNYGGYIPVSITATRIINKKAGLAWTTTDHSGDKVPVYAMGSGAYMFDGEFDDTDIAIRVGDAMGFNGKVTGPTDGGETESLKPTGVGLAAPES
ncbi:alkaline phosphatase [Streptococcus moroccensis]|uniref:Alkaline phosphatase n=1 Tax=Streptococcus moroccensis TaxID=1451356 RepID=A0ABT9YSE5_9STRE|nr:alkaline phosphatase [Streptococcus moroccensis]MDQ0222924.1 alkaline phosphatase [Streptococcus moroccensis]